MKTSTECPECENGQLQSVTEDYKLRTAEGQLLTVPGIELRRCVGCGLVLIPAASSRRISEYEARESEQLTRKELQIIFEQSKLSQKDFAEALGLGEKTFHRWLRGTQVVSRSMGYYVRAMSHFPEAFDWVQSRGWRQPIPRRKKRLSGEIAKFPALQRRSRGAMSVGRSVSQKRQNPASALVLQATHLSSN